MLNCPTDIVDRALCRIITQYRESPRLLGVLRAYVDEAHEVTDALCGMESKFDLAEAEGEQLTIVGKQMGFPRVHCRGAYESVDPTPTVAPAPLCDGRFFSVRPRNPRCAFRLDDGRTMCCGPDETPRSDYTFTDDELYRRFLYARATQINGNADFKTLTAAINQVFGPQSYIGYSSDGVVVAIANRALTVEEKRVEPLYRLVMPLPMGIAFEVTEYPKGICP